MISYDLWIIQIRLTFFTLKSDSRLQVIHLHLKSLEGAVGVAGLALVSDEHGDDDQQEKTSASSDPNDSREGEKTVGVDLQVTGGVLEASCSDLEQKQYEDCAIFLREKSLELGRFCVKP